MIGDVTRHKPEHTPRQSEPHHRAGRRDQGLEPNPCKLSLTTGRAPPASGATTGSQSRSSTLSRRQTALTTGQ